MTSTYEFALVFSVPHLNSKEKMENAIDSLHNSELIGDQISVSFGRPCQLHIDFFYESTSAEDAFSDAINEVKRIMPKAFLVEASPDLVNISSLSEIYGCTRQNMRKYASNEIKGVPDMFPLPSVTSDGSSLWHLFIVSKWIDKNTPMKSPKNIIDVACVAAKLNAEITNTLLIDKSDWLENEHLKPLEVKFALHSAVTSMPLHRAVWRANEDDYVLIIDCSDDHNLRSDNNDININDFDWIENAPISLIN